jgi:hypothetical protein
VIRKLSIDGVDIPVDEFGSSRLEGRNLSDAPRGMSEPMVIHIESKENPSSLKVTSHYRPGGGSASVEGAFENIDLAKLQNSLKSSNTVVLRGGTASAKLSGTMTREVMDIAVAVNVKDLKADASGGVAGMDPQVTSEAMKVLNSLETTLRIAGPTTNPRLVIDSTALGKSMQTALVQAGKDELARRAGQALEGKIPAEVSGLEGILPGAQSGQDPLGGLIGKKPTNSGEGAKSSDDKEAAKKSVDDAIGGLFGKKKEKKDDEKKP